MKRYLFLWAALLILVFLGAYPVRGEVPQAINYQGLVTDKTGRPLDTTLDITFLIYDAPVGGSALWLESHAGVIITGGIFNVLLGQEAYLPGSLFAGGERYLAIKIGLDANIAPRIRMISIPYSAHTGQADAADRFDGYEAAGLLDKAAYDAGEDGRVDANAVAGVGLPIGAVIDWWRANEAVAVPVGFRVCNGSVVDDPESPLYGRAIPNLTDAFVMGVSTTTEIGLTGGQGNHRFVLNLPDHGHEVAIDHDHEYVLSYTWSAGGHYHGIDISHVHSGPLYTAYAGSHTHDFYAGTGPFKYKYADIYPMAEGNSSHRHDFECPVYDGRNHNTTGVSDHYHNPYVNLPAYADTANSSVSARTASVSEADLYPPYVGLLKIMRIR